MISIKEFSFYKLIALVIVLLFSLACNIFTISLRDLVDFGDPSQPDQSDLSQDKDKSTSEEKIHVSDEGTQEDAAHCDALKYINVEVEGPVEETTDSGSYYCYLIHTISNSHPSSRIVISWKHDDSTVDKGPYWTHPTLGPGDSYDLTLRSSRAANGKWSHVDANNLMSWFNTEPCDRYIKQYWPAIFGEQTGEETEEERMERDKLIYSDLSRKELNNPCMR
jgi:hypothetical protein